MTNEIHEAYESYIVLGQQIKELTALRKTAQSVIQGYHANTEQQIITEDGFKSQVISQTSRGLDESLLIAKFGAEALADCYVTKQKTNFRCERLING